MSLAAIYHSNNSFRLDLELAGRPLFDLQEPAKRHHLELIQFVVHFQATQILGSRFFQEGMIH